MDQVRTDHEQPSYYANIHPPQGYGYTPLPMLRLLPAIAVDYCVPGGYFPIAEARDYQGQ